MALSPPSNTDMATRQDVERAQVIMSAQLAEATGYLAQTTGELKADISQVRGEPKAEIKRVGNKTLRWTVVTMLGRNAAVVGILGFLTR